MAEIIMPKMGDAMTEGKVLGGYKKAGEAVKKGAPLLEIEPDKVNLDLEAEQDGTLGNLAVEEGQMVPVGGVLANILGAGEKESVASAAAARPKPAEAAAPAPKAQPKESSTPDQRRATDKKDSVKHTTGEYGEAIEMRGPRIDRSAPQGKVVETPKGDGGHRRSSPLARK